MILKAHVKLFFSIVFLFFIGCTYVRKSHQDYEIKEHTSVSENNFRFELARASLKGGEYNQALGIFEDILEEDPKNVAAHIGVGDTWSFQEDWVTAEPSYAKAAKYGPRNFTAQFKYGLSLQMNGKFKDSIRSYQRALVLKENDLDSNVNIATAFLQIGRPKEAIVFAERSIKIDPNNGAAYNNLGAAYERTGKLDEASKAYITASELMDASPELLTNMLYMLSRQKKYQEVINVAETLLKIDIGSKGAWERKGWGFFKLKKYTQSMESYSEAVHIDPDYVRALNGIGVNAINLWFITGKNDNNLKERASRAFRRSLRIKSDQPKVLKLVLTYQL